MKLLKEWSKEVILLILGASLGFAGNYWLASESKEIPYFDKYISLDKAILAKKSLLSHDVKVFVDDTEVDKISKLNVSLANYSNNFYKDIDILIKLKPKTGDIKVLSSHAAGENNEKTIVTKLKSPEKNTFKYNIKTAKRTDKYDEFFKVIFYYEGDQELSSEEVIVTVLNADPQIRDYNPEHSPENIKTNLKNIRDFIVLIAFVLLAVYFSMSIISRFTRKLDMKANKTYARSLVNASKNIAEFSEVKSAKTTIMDLLYEQRVVRWNSMGWFSRWADGNIPPKRSDFDYED